MKLRNNASKGSDYTRLNVPYPTVVSFRRALRVLSKPEHELAATRSTLIKHRIPKNAVYPVLHALKFFGLTDHRHRARPSLYRFRDEPGHREMLIRKAYAPLIERLSLPVTSRRELIERMKSEIQS